MNKEKTTWIPPLSWEKNMQGWLDVNGETYIIRNIHSFDDLGCTLETFTIEHCETKETKEIYSYDEGETFTFDIN